MKIQIGNNIEYLILEEFIYKGSSNPQFLRITVTLKLNGFTSNLKIDILEDELLDLREGLQKLYDTLKFEFVFSNLDDNIELRFKPTDTGQVIIKGYLRNDDYTAKLDFIIVTDQTFLPKSIKDLNQILNNKGTSHNTEYNL